MSTNWSSPKTNFFAGVKDLYSALASGQNAKLIRLENEKCEYPIIMELPESDASQYRSTGAYLRTRQQILEDNSMSDGMKNLTLNYRSCFGTREAVECYDKTGLVTKDNFTGMGVNHLVKVTDIIGYLQHTGVKGDLERAQGFIDDYTEQGCNKNKRHFYDTYALINHRERTPKHFNKKLWVVALYKDFDKIVQPLHVDIDICLAIINQLMKPLKYIPKKSTLNMGDYTNITYRIGDIVHGWSVQIQVPKKFAFNKR